MNYTNDILNHKTFKFLEEETVNNIKKEFIKVASILIKDSIECFDNISIKADEKTPILYFYYPHSTLRLLENFKIHKMGQRDASLKIMASALYSLCFKNYNEKLYSYYKLISKNIDNHEKIIIAN